MSYMQRVLTCNQHDMSGFRRFVFEHQHIGFVRHAFAEHLQNWPDVFIVMDSQVSLAPQLAQRDVAYRTQAIAKVTAALRDAGVIVGWRDELHRVSESLQTPVLFLLERAAIPYFGVGGYSVHVNGIVRDAGRTWMWIAKRSASKPTYPGKLDQIVAGGLPAGQTLMGNVIKECAEEAAISEAIAQTATHRGCIRYTMETAAGLRPDVVHVYDLALPVSFVPRAADGEVESFQLWDLETVAECVRTTTRFKANCSLVIIDYLLRHGLLGGDEPVADSLRRALRPHEFA